MIKDYDVFNILGKGSFASVFRSIDKLKNTEVAIKMIDKKIMKAKGMAKRIINEVEIHARLKHPSILELYRFFEDRDYVYLVLEICHFGELGTYINKNKIFDRGLSESIVSNFMCQIIQGVLYLHNHYIIHRDLTVSNILLDKNTNIKIADFGLAIQLQKADEKHFTLCGTPNFISPETVANSPHGIQVDIWSLGCILYTMLCGSPPFDTCNIEGTFNKIIAGKFQIPSYIGVNGKDLIIRFLKTNPNSRINLNDALNHMFFQQYTSLKKPQSTQDDGTMIFANISSQFHDDPSPYHHKSRNQNSSTDFILDDQEKSATVKLSLKKLGYKPNLPVLPESEFSNHDNINNYNNNDPFRNAEIDQNHVMNDDKKQKASFNGTLPPKFFTNLRNQLHSLNLRVGVPETREKQLKTELNHGIIKHQVEEKGCNKENEMINCFEKTHETGRQNSQRANRPLKDITNKILHHSPVEEYKSQAKFLQGDRTKTSAGMDKLQNYNPATPSQSDEDGYDPNSSVIDFVGKPLNTRRLKPIKQKTRDVVLSILANGDVCLEYYSGTGEGGSALKQLFKVSNDGLKIEIFDPPTGHSSIHEDSINLLNTFYQNDSLIPGSGDDLKSQPAFQVHDLGNLPKIYWRKYLLASRFVKLVSLKTPKVTVYTNDAKCHLMENSPVPDFEANFYDGPKYSIISTPDHNASPTAFDDNNEEKLSIKFQASSSSSRSKAPQRDLSNYLPYVRRRPSKRKLSSGLLPDTFDKKRLKEIEKSLNYRDYCFQIQTSLESLDSSIFISTNQNTSPFPIVIGSKPKKYSTSTTNPHTMTHHRQLDESCMTISTKVGAGGLYDTAATIDSNNYNTNFNTISSKPSELKGLDGNLRKTTAAYQYQTSYQQSKGRLTSRQDFLPSSNNYKTTDVPIIKSSTNKIFTDNTAATTSEEIPHADPTLNTIYQYKKALRESSLFYPSSGFPSSADAHTTDDDRLLSTSKKLVSAYIPGNCWGLFDPMSKKITAKFLDGIQLILDSEDLRTIRYIDTNSSDNYNNLSYISQEVMLDSCIPNHIKSKLNKIPELVENLRMNAAATMKT